MSSLVIYDSNYGNTKIVAEAIAAELGDGTPCVKVDDVQSDQLNGLHLLVVGSPINGWRPTEKTGAWLSRLRPGQLQGVRAATFDTRITSFFHGNAAKPMSEQLRRAGATLISEPQGFIVKGKEGPLAEGEIQRAQQWVKTLLLNETTV